MMEREDSQSTAALFVLIRAADAFFAKHSRYPGIILHFLSINMRMYMCITASYNFGWQYPFCFMCLHIKFIFKRTTLFCGLELIWKPPYTEIAIVVSDENIWTTSLLHTCCIALINPLVLSRDLQRWRLGEWWAIAESYCIPTVSLAGHIITNSWSASIRGMPLRSKWAALCWCHSWWHCCPRSHQVDIQAVCAALWDISIQRYGIHHNCFGCMRSQWWFLVSRAQAMTIKLTFISFCPAEEFCLIIEHVIDLLWTGRTGWWH